MFKIKYSKAICPLCHAPLKEDNNSIFCSKTEEQKCHFNISNNLNGKKINLKDFLTYQNLCSKHYNKYKKIHDFAKKQENEYIKEIMDMQKRREKVVRERLADKDDFFKTSKEYSFRCMNCNEDLHFNDGIIKCTNEDCNFTLNTHYNGVTFSREEIIELLRLNISDEYIFKINNKEQKGRVYLDFNTNNEKITSNYIFVSDISQIPKKKRKYMYKIKK